MSTFFSVDPWGWTGYFILTATAVFYYRCVFSLWFPRDSLFQRCAHGCLGGNPVSWFPCCMCQLYLGLQRITALMVTGEEDQDSLTLARYKLREISPEAGFAGRHSDLAGSATRYLTLIGDVLCGIPSVTVRVHCLSTLNFVFCGRWLKRPWRQV